jgi:hypothetical protein
MDATESRVILTLPFSLTVSPLALMPSRCPLTGVSEQRTADGRYSVLFSILPVIFSVTSWVTCASIGELSGSPETNA